MKLRIAFALVGVVMAFSLMATRASALNGPCYGQVQNPLPRYFSYTCYLSTSKWSGAFAGWSSLPQLNLTQRDAANGDFIAQVLWFYDVESTNTWLEIGDTAGGGGIVGHRNEWARMWYWVDGTLGSANQIQNFWAYSPSDGSAHTYGFQYDFPTSLWQICKDSVCPYTLGWKSPNLMPQTDVMNGMEIRHVDPTTGQLLPLDSSMNSSNFVVSPMYVRNNPDTSWLNWPSAATQDDATCGSPPSCLYGYFQLGVPPYDHWLDGKPQ